MPEAVEWIRQSSLSPSLKDAAIALVPTIPTRLAGMPYCPACESVLCGACGHCHMLGVVPFSRPECPNDHDDMGSDCAAWWQAFNAVQTVQRMNETSEQPEMRLCKACGQYHPIGADEWYCPLDPNKVN